MIPLVLLALLNVPGNGGLSGHGYAEVVAEATNLISSARIANVKAVNVDERAQCGNVAMRGLFQHPNPTGDAVVSINVSLPETRWGEHLIATFSYGLKDGIDYHDEAHPPNGVVFAMKIDDTVIFNERVTQSKWKRACIDITPFAGRDIEWTFITNAYEGNSYYDWAFWGEPVLLKLFGGPMQKIRDLETDGAGIVLIENDPSSPAKVALDGIPQEIPQDRELFFIPVVSGHSTFSFQGGIKKAGYFKYVPSLVIKGPFPQSPLILSATCEVEVVVENIGRARLVRGDNARVRLEGLRDTKEEKTIEDLGPGEGITLRWKGSLGSNDTSRLKATVEWRMGKRQSETSVTRTPYFPDKHNVISATPRCVKRGNVISLEGPRSRWQFVSSGRGVEYVMLEIAVSDRYVPAGVMVPMGELCLGTGTEDVETISVRPVVTAVGRRSIRLEDTFEDGSGRKWTWRGRFGWGSNPSLLEVEVSIRCNSPASLLAFRSPPLYVGEMASGEKKKFALFPGLEFLEKGEPSSDTRDAKPPVNLRLVPNPLKITVPLAAVRVPEGLVGMMWDPLQTWDGKERMPSCLFASPNFVDHQKNHKMQLFVPSVPKWVPENHMVAETPYEMQSGGRLIMHFSLIADPDLSILDATDLWWERFGFPKPLDPPRSFQEELALSRYGFMVTVWSDELKRSMHAVGWSPINAPGFATLLWLDRIHQKDERLRKDLDDRVALIARETIEASGPEGLSSTNGCNILKWEFPFYYGHVIEALKSVREEVLSFVKKQEDDGTWVFSPGKKNAILGEKGDAVLGTCAGNAMKLLKYIRISGDESFKPQAEKALDAMKRFKVPRGAQNWECPLYTPDLLAAAWAVMAYVEAYRIWNEQDHLEQAIYWARAGIPFVYAWNMPGRPLMRYSTIPVFGTTFYTHSWFGVPVQWNGLVFAYALQKLWGFDRSRPWRDIAEGITINAMYQQWTEGKFKGTYPDKLDEYFTKGKGPHLNPEDIMVNLFTLKGVDPDISSEILRREQEAVHLSSGADLRDAEWIGRTLRFRLDYVQGEFSHTLIAPIEEPVKVMVEGRAISGSGEFSWSYDYDFKAIYLKLLHVKRQLEVSVTTAE